MLLRRWLTPLLLVSILLASCAGDSSHADHLLLEEEPPTPPPLEGVDATHLVAAFPQEPLRAGEVWVRPGSVSNIIKKQQPPEPEPASQPADKTTEARPPGKPGPSAKPEPEPADERIIAEATPPARTVAGPSAAASIPVKPRAEKAPLKARRGARPANGAAAETATSQLTAAAATAPPADPPPALAETNHLSIAKAALATKIQDRQPVGVSNTFAEGTKVYMFNTILNPDGKSVLIHHKWYRGAELAAAVKLSIKAARWRTWSVIPVYGKGPWRVDIVEPSGRVIHSEKFTVN